MERMEMNRSRILALMSVLLIAALMAGCIEESPIAFSPDGKTLAFVTAEPHRAQDGGFAAGAQTSRLMLLDEQRKIRVLETATDAMLSAPAFSPDGRRLAYLRVPLQSKEQAEAQQKDFDERVKSLQKLVNPAWMAWVTGPQEGAATQPIVPQVQDQALPPLKGTYVAAAMMMLSADTPATLVVRDVRSGQILSSTPLELLMSAPAYESTQPQFDPDGQRVYLATGNLILAIDLASGAKRVLGSGGGPARLSPDGRMLAMTAGDVLGLIATDGSFALYRRLPASPASGLAWIDARTVAVLQDKVKSLAAATQLGSEKPAAGSQPAATQPAGPAVFVVQRVRTDGTLQEPAEIPVPELASGAGNINQFAAAPDGRHLVISYGNGVVFGTPEGKTVRYVDVPEMRLEQPAFSPDSSRVVVKVLATAEDKSLRTAAIAFYSAEGKELYRVAIPAVEAATTGPATQPAAKAGE